MSDQALLRQIGNFVQHHRVQQNKTQNDLAHQAGISRSTLSLLERGEPVTLPTLVQVLRVVGQLQVLEAFLVQQPISPLALVQQQREQKPRQRVRGQVKKLSTVDW